MDCGCLVGIFNNPEIKFFEGVAMSRSIYLFVTFVTAGMLYWTFLYTPSPETATVWVGQEQGYKIVFKNKTQASLVQSNQDGTTNELIADLKVKENTSTHGFEVSGGSFALYFVPVSGLSRVLMCDVGCNAHIPVLPILWNITN